MPARSRSGSRDVTAEPTSRGGRLSQGEQILDGVWRFEGVHPEWTEHEGGEDGWEPQVASWAVASEHGLVLIDPLVADWAALDHLVDAAGCAGIIRTCHWHQRSVSEAAARYGADVSAKAPPDGVPEWPHDISVKDGDEVLDAFHVIDVERDDEIALWHPGHRALFFGDAMLRRTSGELRVCPESWTQPKGGPARLREILGGLTALPVEHVLVSHGPLVLGDGDAALRRALT